VIYASNWWVVATSNIFLGMQQALVWSATIFIMIDYLGQGTCVYACAYAYLCYIWLHRLSDSPNSFLEFFFSNSVLLCSFLWAVEWIHESPPSVFPNSERKSPKRGLGRSIERWRYQCNFPGLHEPQLSAMRCVPLNQIDPSYVICIPSFVVLCPHYSTLSSRLFLSVGTRFLEKGEFSNRL